VAVLATWVASADGQIVFEQDFVQGQPSPAQCTAWRAFAAELVEQDYRLLVLRGSNDPEGVSCGDPDVIAQIAANINTNNQARLSYPCDGRTWMTGGCGGGVELSAAGSICACPNPQYIVRPCIGNANWGGVNTATCNGASQTIIVEFFTGGKCQYTVRKSKAKGGCESCPAPGDNLPTFAECEDVEDCRKKIRTQTACPDGPGSCKLKGKRAACG